MRKEQERLENVATKKQKQTNKMRTDELITKMFRYPQEDFFADFKVGLLSQKSKKRTFMEYALRSGSLAFLNQLFLSFVDSDEFRMKEVDILMTVNNLLEGNTSRGTEYNTFLLRFLCKLPPHKVIPFLDGIRKKLTTKEQWQMFMSHIEVAGYRHLLEMSELTTFLNRVSVPVLLEFMKKVVNGKEMEWQHRFRIALLTSSRDLLGTIPEPALVKLLQEYDLFKFLATLRDRSFRKYLYNFIRQRYDIFAVLVDRIHAVYFYRKEEGGSGFADFILDAMTETNKPGCLHQFKSEEYLVMIFRIITDAIRRKLASVWLDHFFYKNEAVTQWREKFEAKHARKYPGVPFTHGMIVTRQTLRMLEMSQMSISRLVTATGKEGDVFDLGVLMLKGLVPVIPQLLSLLIQKGLVDMHCYGDTNPYRQIHKLTVLDENPIFLLKGSTLRLFVQHADQVYMNKLSSFTGDIPVRQVILGSDELFSDFRYWDSVLKLFYQYRLMTDDVLRDLLVHETITNNWGGGREAFAVASLIMFLYEGIKTSKHSLFPVQVVNTMRAMFICKLMMSRGADASYLGRLFKDYQDWRYAKMLQWPGERSLPDLNNHIAEFLNPMYLFRTKDGGKTKLVDMLNSRGYNLFFLNA